MEDISSENKDSFAYMRCLLFGDLSHNVFLRLSGARFCICLFITKDQVSLG